MDGSNAGADETCATAGWVYVRFEGTERRRPPRLAWPCRQAYGYGGQVHHHRLTIFRQHVNFLALVISDSLRRVFRYRALRMLECFLRRYLNRNRGRSAPLRNKHG